MNDDDGEREMGLDSRLIFTAPSSGRYLVRVTDTRGWSGDRYAYRLVVWPPVLDFSAKVLAKAADALPAGSAVQFLVKADRMDGFEGDVRVDVSRTPDGFYVSSPIVVEAGHLTAAGVFAALVAVMWAYDGWSDLSSLAGEVHAPERTLPRAFVLATLATTLVYLVVNLAYARVLGFDGIARSTVGAHMVAGNLATATLGEAGLRALSALVFLSCLGASMSTLLTGPRVLVAMASRGHIGPGQTLACILGVLGIAGLVRSRLQNREVIPRACSRKRR